MYQVSHMLTEQRTLMTTMLEMSLVSDKGEKTELIFVTCYLWHFSSKDFLPFICLGINTLATLVKVLKRALHLAILLDLFIFVSVIHLIM